MNFTCAYCKDQIQELGSIHHGEFLHHKCVEAYNELMKEKIEEEEILSED